jgi:hypothetical protein
MILTNVLSATLIYFMSTFNIPKEIIRLLDKIRRRFLWHGHKEHLPKKNHMPDQLGHSTNAKTIWRTWCQRSSSHQPSNSNEMDVDAAQCEPGVVEPNQCYVCGPDFRSMRGVAGGRQPPASGV